MYRVKEGRLPLGNMARLCFANKNNFIQWISTLIPSEFRDTIRLIHQNLSAILRVFNCSHPVKTDKLDSLCKQTYECIVIEFPWVNITPSLHKLLAHSPELIQSCNDGYGMKQFSEEALEACNKLIRKYRDNLSRKCSFNANITDIFVRLMSESDPVLLTFRRVPKCKFCGANNHYCHSTCPNNKQEMIEQNVLVDSLLCDIVD